MPCASIRKALAGRVPLIGFSGSPWTLACYMVEGAGSDDYRLVKTMLYSRPDLMHRILDINADAVAAYLNAQIDAGAQAVMIFDTWGGVLADGAFQQFSLPYTQQRAGAAADASATACACPASSSPRAAGRGCSRLPASVPTWSGWTGRSTSARRAPASATGVALQGNLDPNVLFAPPAAGARPRPSPRSRASARRACRRPRDGHVFNLGHGISQHTPPEHVAVLVDAVHAHSRRLRAAVR